MVCQGRQGSQQSRVLLSQQKLVKYVEMLLNEIFNTKFMPAVYYLEKNVAG